MILQADGFEGGNRGRVKSLEPSSRKTELVPHAEIFFHYKESAGVERNNPSLQIQ